MFYISILVLAWSHAELSAVSWFDEGAASPHLWSDSPRCLLCTNESSPKAQPKGTLSQGSPWKHVWLLPDGELPCRCRSWQLRGRNFLSSWGKEPELGWMQLLFDDIGMFPYLLPLTAWPWEASEIWLLRQDEACAESLAVERMSGSMLHSVQKPQRGILLLSLSSATRPLPWIHPRRISNNICRSRGAPFSSF